MRYMSQGCGRIGIMGDVRKIREERLCEFMRPTPEEVRTLRSSILERRGRRNSWSEYGLSVGEVLTKRQIDLWWKLQELKERAALSHAGHLETIQRLRELSDMVAADDSKEEDLCL